MTTKGNPNTNSDKDFVETTVTPPVGVSKSVRSSPLCSSGKMPRKTKAELPIAQKKKAIATLTPPDSAKVPSSIGFVPVGSEEDSKKTMAVNDAASASSNTNTAVVAGTESTRAPEPALLVTNPVGNNKTDEEQKARASVNSNSSVNSTAGDPLAGSGRFMEGETHRNNHDSFDQLLADAFSLGHARGYFKATMMQCVLMGQHLQALSCHSREIARFYSMSECWLRNLVVSLGPATDNTTALQTVAPHYKELALYHEQIQKNMHDEIAGKQQYLQMATRRILDFELVVNQTERELLARCHAVGVAATRQSRRGTVATQNEAEGTPQETVPKRERGESADTAMDGESPTKKRKLVAPVDATAVTIDSESQAMAGLAVQTAGDGDGAETGKKAPRRVSVAVSI